ncbi:dermokine-like [Pollicipes pollicipes]|uniref:dermokine-like n=1 Tax=Pollicipes pollicipes TaxID=41117 RepID=UPI001884E0CF|nr:dermokine-like [Pollicipes pollicipes]XP_037074730.1 dermokine-like [Pollicipes pollicipes]
MKTATILLCLVAVAAGVPVPAWWNQRGGSASGGANANVVSGFTSGNQGSSRITSVGASAGGSASNGGSSYNRGSASQSSSSGFFGNSQRADTSAQSNQYTNNRYSYNRFG